MRWENKVPLTDFLSNISTKHYQNRFMYVEVIASQSSDVFGRMSIMKHRMQITQQENMIWWQNPLCSCNRGLHHCQKMTIMFVTNTPAVHVYLINSPQFNAVAENVHLLYKHKLADVFFAIHWCELHQWLSAAALDTHQSSTASVVWHHGSSSEHCCIVFQIL